MRTPRPSRDDVEPEPILRALVAHEVDVVVIGGSLPRQDLDITPDLAPASRETSFPVAGLADIVRSKDAANRDEDRRTLPVLRERLAAQTRARAARDAPPPAP